MANDSVIRNWFKVSKVDLDLDFLDLQRAKEEIINMPTCTYS